MGKFYFTLFTFEYFLQTTKFEVQTTIISINLRIGLNKA